MPPKLPPDEVAALANSRTSNEVTNAEQEAATTTAANNARIEQAQRDLDMASMRAFARSSVLARQEQHGNSWVTQPSASRRETTQFPYPPPSMTRDTAQKASSLTEAELLAGVKRLGLSRAGTTEDRNGMWGPAPYRFGSSGMIMNRPGPRDRVLPLKMPGESGGAATEGRGGEDEQASAGDDVTTEDRSSKIGEGGSANGGDDPATGDNQGPGS